MSTCRSCGETILWAETENGKKMPVDSAPVFGGNLSLLSDGKGGWKAIVIPEAERGTMLLRKSHFASCPKAAAHRRGR